MRTTIINVSILLLFLSCSSRAYSQTSTRNYIYARTYTNDANTSHRDVIQYFNGLGYPDQTVKKNFSPSGGDVANLQTYDGFGRETCSWLPVDVSNNNGGYVMTDLLMGAKTYYGNDSHPYSEKIYEPYAPDRVVEEYAPGADWRTNGKSVKTEYLTNADSVGDLACARYIVSGTGVNSQLTRSGHYADGTMHVTKVTDEDGRTTYEFKDRQERVLLIRQKNGQESLDTYYVFDDFGNTCFVLPPSASASLAAYAYQYKYDARSRCISKKLPGCDWIYYVYDSSDRQIFSQDGEQRLRGEWLFSIPDAQGRTVLTGVCKNNLNYSANPLNNVHVQADRSTVTNAMHGYSISGISLATPTVLTVNYYDDYDFMGYNGIPNATNADMKYEPTSGFGTRYEDSKGLLTGTVTSRLPTEGATAVSYLNSVIYYDYRGRVIQTKSENHLGGVEKVFTAYNFTGDPVQVKKVHTVTGNDSQTEAYAYTYDNVGRLLKTTYQLNSSAAVTLADNSYDEIGRLKSDSRNGNAKLKTDYTYNLRSWTIGINGALFTQTLSYQEAGNGNTPCYSGNISSMWWKSGSETAQRGYHFLYDGLSRLKDAVYGEGVTLATHPDRFNEQITGYDKMGNILGLKRNGQTAADSYGMIDNLSYTYNGSQLQAVKDAATGSAYGNGTDFKDGANLTIEYMYDKNGNLTKDLNKNISDIQYNLLNLPSKVTFANGNSINYEYGMDGTKLHTIHKSGSTTLTTDYCGNAVYENGALKLLLNEAGYVSFPDKKFHFYLRDHQGNTRVVADKDGNVEETNAYYPFGGSFTSTASVQPYKYNGKELDTKNGLNWYDYGARHYDAAICRWHVVDPMAEEYYSSSPYAYCVNNPIKHIDPDGRTIVIWYKNENGSSSSFTYSGGNVTHSNPFVQSVITAYQYNKANGIKAGNGGGASTVAIVENTKIRVNVTEAIYDVTYSPDAARGAGSIFWKSDWGTQYDNGVINSPATLFDHEANHALEHKTNPEEYEKNRMQTDLQYGTKEERRVITGSEQKTSRANGETRPGQVTRRNHNGKRVITKGVTSNIIDRLKTKDYEEREKEVWTSEP